MKGEISLSLTAGMKSIVMFDFKVDAEPPKLGYIFTTMYATRKLFLDGQQIVLECGMGQIRLPYHIHRWNMVYIELNNPPEGEMDSIFRVNEKSGVFRIYTGKVDETLFIGGMLGDIDHLYFQGQIGRFEIFERICDGEYVNLPENIRRSYIQGKYKTLL